MKAVAGSLFVASLGAMFLLVRPADAACEGASPSWSSTPDFASLDECVSSAGAGDTITVLAGTATWGAGSHVAITKSLTIMGAGMAETTIVDETPQGTTPLDVILSGTDRVSISGIGFQRVEQDPPNYNPIIGFHTSGTTFSRVHDCRFEDVGGRSIGASSPYLLIDSNVFTCADAWCAPIIVGGDQSGDRPMDYGGPSFVFVENNIFDFSNVTGGERDGALDCKDKGRFVFRYNTVLGTRVMNHGFDSTISCMSFEIYDNRFTDDGPDFQNGFFVQLRGGTGLIHGNAMGGSTQLWGAPLGATNYRSCSENAQITASKACDGTEYGVCTELAWGEWANCTSSTDCSDLGAGTCERHWCSVSRDILCTSSAECPNGESCTGLTDGEGAHGYPCRDQIGRGPNQQTYPLYVWDNVAYGETVGLAILDNGGGTCYTSEHIQADRDYCEHAPATSCGAVAGWTYTPFACPHPATGLTGQCDPAVDGTDGYNRTCETEADCTLPLDCHVAAGASCAEGVCTYPAAADGTACTSDDDPCTDDVCESGECAHPESGDPSCGAGGHAGTGGAAAAGGAPSGGAGGIGAVTPSEKESDCGCRLPGRWRGETTAAPLGALLAVAGWTRRRRLPVIARAIVPR